MKPLRFKTNLKCEGCVAAIKPGLDALEATESWRADLNSPEKIVTVETDLPVADVIKAIRTAGYAAEVIE